VPTYNPRDIASNIKRMIRGEVMEPMHPWFRGFRGGVDLSVSKKGEVSYAISGIYTKLNDTTLEVTELPVGKWTQQYKEFLEELMDTDGGKKEPFIKGYREYHTDTTVHFEIQMSEKSMQEAEEVGIAKKFQLSRNLTTTNMHLFNADGQITKYSSPEEILRDFYRLRLVKYEERKAYMSGEMERQLSVLDNKVRFIREVVAGTLVVSNRKKADVVADLTKRGYTPMAKESQKKKAEQEDAQEAGEEPHAESVASFDYLLNMAIMSLTLERVQQLQADRDAKAGELETLLSKTPAMLWEEDLDRFAEEYDRYEEAEALKASLCGKKAKGGKGSKAAAGKKKAGAAKKRKTSWGESEGESDDVDDDSEDDFVPKKAAVAKKPAAPPAKAAAPAARVAEAPKAPPPKKLDAKLTPDKTKMKPPSPALSEEAETSLSLFDRLNLKASSVALAGKPPAKAAAPAKKAPKKAEWDDDDEDGGRKSGSDDEFVPGGKKKGGAFGAAPAAAAKAKKAPAKKAPKADSDDEVDMEEAMEALRGSPVENTLASHKPRRAAAAKKTIIESRYSRCLFLLFPSMFRFLHSVPALLVSCISYASCSAATRRRARRRRRTRSSPPRPRSRSPPRPPPRRSLRPWTTTTTRAGAPRRARRPRRRPRRRPSPSRTRTTTTRTLAARATRTTTTRRRRRRRGSPRRTPTSPRRRRRRRRPRRSRSPRRPSPRRRPGTTRIPTAVTARR
jgi:DNA topoisomerase II